MYLNDFKHYFVPHNRFLIKLYVIKNKISMKNKTILIVSLISILTLVLGYIYQRMLKEQHSKKKIFIVAEKGIIGIDVSHHNGIINWEMVNTSEIKFVIIKSTEGNSSAHSDTLFKTNWNKSLEKKLIVGAYHMFGINSSGNQQFNNYISVVPKLNNSMPPLIDVSKLSEAKDISKLIKELKILEYKLHKYYCKKPIIQRYCQQF